MRARSISGLVALALAGCGGISALDQPSECGDGWTGPGEECDDADQNGEHSGCTPDCRQARCGDGLVWYYHEQCDDQNDEYTDGCDECLWGQNQTWTAEVAGADSITAAAGRVYLAGHLSPQGSATPIVILNPDTGAIASGDPWADYAGTFPIWGSLSVAARPGGAGAVVTGDFARSGQEAVAITGWFDTTGQMTSRYQVATPGDSIQIGGVVVGPSGLVGVAGASGAHGWLLVLQDGEYVWDALYDGAGAIVLNHIDLDAGGTFAIGGVQAPDHPLAALDQLGAATTIWTRVMQPMGGGDTIRDVRLVSNGVLVARNWSDSRQHAVVQRLSLANGSVAETTELDIPPFLQLDGISLMADGRALTYGRNTDYRWLAMHDQEGLQRWRADPVALWGDVVDAVSVDGRWVYAIVGDHVDAWQVE